MLVTRLLSAFEINLYIPISKVLSIEIASQPNLQVDENMAKAHKRGAVLHEKFYFRKSLRQGIFLLMHTVIHPLGEDIEGPEYELMTINEIMNGKVNIVWVCRMNKFSRCGRMERNSQD